MDACVLSGGQYRDINAESVVARAAASAYQRAGITAADVQVAELHDATAFCELLHYESLGFCPQGDGGRYFDEGASQIDGVRPTNLSGGLISKGHPLAASGLGMVQEIVTQLRCEAGERQAKRTLSYGLVQNAGGSMGFDEALCGITLLRTP